MMVKKDYFISTSKVSSKEALPYWNDYVGNKLFNVAAKTNYNLTNFYGSLAGYAVDNIQLCKISACSHGVYKTKKQIAKSTESYFLVNFQITGESYITQDGRTVHLKANNWSFTDSTRPYLFNFTTDFELLILKIPRNQITYATTYITSNTAKLLDDHGLGKILKNYVYSISHELKTLDTLTRKYLANNLLKLFNDYLNLKFILESSTDSLNETMLIKVKFLINEQITNPQLSIQYIANIFKCSKRQLHTIFNNENFTISRYIKDTRLENCKVDLENFNFSKLTIAEIAYKNGFNDISYFAKSFKQKYNVPPGEYRSLNAQAININSILNIS